MMEMIDDYESEVDCNDENDGDENDDFQIFMMMMNESEHDKWKIMKVKVIMKRVKLKVENGCG